MQLDKDYNFCKPSLRTLADIWIGILDKNGFNRRVANCLVYSSILIFNLLPISGPSDWATMVNMDRKLVVKSPTYGWVLEQTQQPVKSMLMHIVDELCVNTVGLFCHWENSLGSIPVSTEGHEFRGCWCVK